GAIGARLAAGAGQLNASDAALLRDEADGAGQRFDVGVAPDAEVLRTDAALRYDGRRLREDEAGAADRPAAQVDEVPIGGAAVAARILTHRRHRDAITQRHATEGQRLEQVRHEVSFVEAVSYAPRARGVSQGRAGCSRSPLAHAAGSRGYSLSPMQ